MLVNPPLSAARGLVMRYGLAPLIVAGAMLIDASAYADGFFPPVGPAGNFGGIGVGLDLGASVGGAGNVNTSGVSGGGHVGYNLQNGPIVGGVEADALLGSISGNANLGTLNQTWLTSARIRGGYAFGDFPSLRDPGPAPGPHRASSGRATPPTRRCTAMSSALAANMRSRA